MHKLRVALLIVCSTLVVQATFSHSLHAASIDVPCSVPALITALDNANTNPDSDTLNLSPNCTYTLTTANNTVGLTGPNGLPVVTTPIIVNGQGASIVRSSTDGTPKFRIWYISSTGQLTLNQLTVSQGDADTFDGGGLYNLGTTTVRDSTFSSNASTATGGGIYNTAVLSVLASSSSGNQGQWGGAVANFGGQLKVKQSSFAKNTSSLYGGAISNFKGQVTVKRATFSENQADDRGGAIANFADQNYPAPLKIIKSTFSSNRAVWGGAIYNDGTLDLRASTLNRNRTLGNSGLGGALYNSQKGKVANTTFWMNQASSQGGAIWAIHRVQLYNVTLAGNTAPLGTALYIADGTTTLVNTIVADSSADDNCQLQLGKLKDDGHNLDSDGTCGVGPAVVVGLDPAGLKDNGGPTRTIALRSNSPAIDAGADQICQQAPVGGRDQRGVKRPQGVHCDIGAFERKP